MQKHCWNRSVFSAVKEISFLNTGIFPDVNDKHKLFLYQLHLISRGHGGSMPIY